MTVKLIAEFCQNHNGNYDLLAKMVESAAKSGATYGKMQMIYADTLAFRPEFEEGLVQNGVVKAIKRPYLLEKNRLKKLELDVSAHQELISYCQEKNIMFLSSPFDNCSVNLLNDLGLQIFKIPSGEITNLPYLRHIGSLCKKVILSTGMSNLGDIEKALILLHQGVFRRRQDFHQSIFVQLLKGCQDRQAADKLGNKTELKQIFRFHIP